MGLFSNNLAPLFYPNNLIYSQKKLFFQFSEVRKPSISALIFLLIMAQVGFMIHIFNQKLFLRLFDFLIDLHHLRYKFIKTLPILFHLIQKSIISFLHILLFALKHIQLCFNMLNENIIDSFLLQFSLLNLYLNRFQFPLQRFQAFIELFKTLDSKDFIYFLNFYRKFALTLNFYIFFLFQSQSINVPILDVRIRWINKVVKINSLNTFASQSIYFNSHLSLFQETQSHHFHNTYDCIKSLMKKPLDSIHLNSKTQDSNTLNSVHGLSKSQPTWLKQSNYLLKSNNSSKSNENIQENRNQNLKKYMNSLTSTTSNTIRLPTLDYITTIIKPETISLQSLQNLSISSFSHQTLSLFNNNNPHTQKSQQTKEKFLRDESIIRALYQEVRHMKVFVEKQVKQKVMQMHKLFTEGNKKSIQLIMLIIKELERQNSRLRMELQMSKTQLVRSQLQNKAKNRHEEEQNSHQYNHFKQTKSYSSIEKSDGCKNILMKQQSKKVNCGDELIEIIHNNEINDSLQLNSPSKLTFQDPIEISRVISHSNQTKNQLSPNSSNSTYQQSEHNQSILLFANDHLEIIQEMQNDDEEIQELKDCTILMESEYKYNISNIIDKNQQCVMQIDCNGNINEMILSFNEGIQKIDNQNCHHQSEESLINVLLESHEKPMYHHNFNEPIAPIAYYTEKSNVFQTYISSQQLAQEPEESSIVKKLLKIKSLSSKHKKKSQSQKIDLDLSLKNVSMYDMNEKMEISMETSQVDMNLTSINFDTNPIDRDYQISEALSVLKQYNLTQNITQTPKNITLSHPKIVRPNQYFPKIKPALQLTKNQDNSLYNKQNIHCQTLHSKSPQIKQSKHSSPHVVGLKHQSLRIISPRMIHNR